MRVAPSVQALSCGAGTWLSVQQGLYALSAFVLVYWAGRHIGAGPWGSLLASLGLAIAAAILAGRVLRQPARQLVWDGAQWAVLLTPEHRQAGAVMLMLDLGGWMLVKFAPAEPSAASSWRLLGPSQWLALSQCDNAAVWAALRVALHSWRPVQGSPDVASSSMPGA